MNESQQFLEFLDAYIDALLWSSIIFTSEDDDEGVHADEYPISEEACAQCWKDCEDFMQGSETLLNKATYAYPDYSYTQAGHDFALTRNGHGAGFWDRGLGELGEELTADAKAYGSVDLYLDDNEQVRIA